MKVLKRTLLPKRYQILIPVKRSEVFLKTIKKWPEFLAICKENDFFIGMYNYINEEYCYNWIRDIVEQYTGEKLKKEKKSRKKSIPKKIISHPRV